jgi:hypothetical protein
MRLAYDAALRRPACVLIAAGLGGDTRATMEFPSETWLVSLTDGMRVYEVSEELLARLVQETDLRRKVGEG